VKPEDWAALTWEERKVVMNRHRMARVKREQGQRKPEREPVGGTVHWLREPIGVIVGVCSDADLALIERYRPWFRRRRDGC